MITPFHPAWRKEDGSSSQIIINPNTKDEYTFDDAVNKATLDMKNNKEDIDY